MGLVEVHISWHEHPRLLKEKKQSWDVAHLLFRSSTRNLFQVFKGVGCCGRKIYEKIIIVEEATPLQGKKAYLNQKHLIKSSNLFHVSLYHFVESGGNT